MRADWQRRRAGDFDYEGQGQGYAVQRRTDPRIAALVHEALGAARTVLNVGAGAGSYEPADRYVLAVEPSAAMRSQRPKERVPAIDAVAEDLPLDDDAVDAAMATLTVHQWPDPEKGLRERSWSLATHPSLPREVAAVVQGSGVPEQAVTVCGDHDEPVGILGQPQVPLPRRLLLVAHAHVGR